MEPQTTRDELNELREEFDKLKLRVDHIAGVLSRYGVNTPPSDPPVLDRLDLIESRLRSTGAL